MHLFIRRIIVPCSCLAIALSSSSSTKCKSFLLTSLYFPMSEKFLSRCAKGKSGTGEKLHEGMRRRRSALFCAFIQRLIHLQSKTGWTREASFFLLCHYYYGCVVTGKKLKWGSLSLTNQTGLIILHDWKLCTIYYSLFKEIKENTYFSISVYTRCLFDTSAWFAVYSKNLQIQKDNDDDNASLY